jgi:hypothetical protein
MISLSKCVFALAVVQALGCSGDATALCEDDRPQPSVLSACVTGPTIEEPSDWPGVLEERIEGVVEDIGEGGTEDCFGAWWGSLGDLVDSEAPELDEAQWISLRTSQDQLFRVEVIAPDDFQWDTTVGEILVVDLWQQWHGFPPTESNLEVRVQEGDLVYWMGIAWKLEALLPPDEIELADTGDGCRVVGDSCSAEWEERSLSVTVGSKTEAVAYGTHASIGTLTFLSHAFEVETVPTACADHFVGTAEAAAWAN